MGILIKEQESYGQQNGAKALQDASLLIMAHFRNMFPASLGNSNPLYQYQDISIQDIFKRVGARIKLIVHLSLALS